MKPVLIVENSEFVASGSDDGRWFIWEKQTALLALCSRKLCSVPFDCFVATSGIDNLIKLWSPTAVVPSMVAGGSAGPEAANALEAMESPMKFWKLHTKKRNRLAQSRLNDMVFVKFNRPLERRAKSKETDPILLQDIDKSNEWFMGRMENDDEAVFVGEDLTWSDVANASGAYEPSYLTRASKVVNDGAGPSRNDKGKSPAHNPISSRPSRRCLVDEDEMEEDIGVSSDEGDGVVQVDDDDDLEDF
ncbi:hypothetical protein F3Y22_tig00112491pilonHSYRG00253 [Hibiscus syriacus]|uniref:Uncharacterized protein n=1 Tax=Hibiscus syriacus TaxID=106335 RepID=A0A6A2XHV0_HIBSY|nr:hypothetical protein F3Y22_tig00112491pilonHSYRG00253 [Hibiscus syriacus]